MRLPPFQALLDAHGRDVHRFLVASVGPVEADDCFQETWLAALRAYPKLSDDSNLRAWLFTIAHRKVIDHARGRARRPVPVAEVPERHTDGQTAITVVGPAVADGDLWAAVGALPEKQRTAVALRFIADSAYAEIAVVMGTSEEAARRSVHEGLKRLRKDPPV
ncbi:MAG: sigma-70 family RNA polymerase sigma factor [Solirubrobacteraceae bacterium]